MLAQVRYSCHGVLSQKLVVGCRLQRQRVHEEYRGWMATSQLYYQFEHNIALGQ